MTTRRNGAKSVHECPGGYLDLVAGFSPKTFRLEFQRTAPYYRSAGLDPRGRAQIVGPIGRKFSPASAKRERFRMIMNELRDYPEAPSRRQ